MMKKIITVIAMFAIAAFMCFSDESSNAEINGQIYGAIMENRLSDLAALVSKSKDLNQPTTENKNVFDAVLVFNNCEAAEILFKNKLDIDKKVIDGKTIRQAVQDADNAKLIALIKKYYPE